MNSMADVFSTAKRSQIMSRVRHRGNKATELALINLFRRYALSGWRRGARIFGKPDFIFPKRRLAVFADGCFWHSCPEHQTRPANNKAFWKAKLARNKARDKVVTRTLKREGWNVLRVWQHELSRKNEDRLLRRIRNALML